MQTGRVSALDTVAVDLEPYRHELTGFCYRMLGTLAEADDAVQETFINALRSYDRFEGRSSLRTWLYRIARNVCLDMHRSPQRRARPMELGGPTRFADIVSVEPSPEDKWLQPAPDHRVIDLGGDPAEVAQLRESVRLAFVAALQHLPERQRCALILADVLRWSAAEIAELLECSVAAVNSALQRGRATLQARQGEPLDPVTDSAQAALLERYVAAFEAYDMDALVATMRDDVVMSMPPFDLWLEGTSDIVAFMRGPGAACEGSRLIPVAVNGTAGFGSYKPVAPGVWEPWGVQVIEVTGGLITGFHHFIYPERFTECGLPGRIVE